MKALRKMQSQKQNLKRKNDEQGGFVRLERRC